MLEIAENNPVQIRDFNLTARDFPDRATVAELIEAQVRRRPGQIALFSDHDSPSEVTYQALNQRADLVAQHLRRQGVGAGQIIGVLTERSVAMMAGILGILKAGAAYLPISPDDPPDRIAYILRDAQVRLLLVHGATAAKAPDAVTVLNLDEPVPNSSEPVPPAGGTAGPACGPRDLAYVIYTSGSTGRPKGVMVEHRSVVNRLHWMQQAYPLGARDRLIQKTPYVFDVSVWELFWGLIEGSSLCLLRPGGERSPQVLLDTVRRREVTVMHFVPSMLNVFLEYLEGRPERVAECLRSVRRVFASGEALSPAHVDRFHSVIGRVTGCQLTNLYGPTEATVDATAFDCPAGRNLTRIPIGRPIQNMRAYVLGPDGLADLGESGELCLAGVGLARGYLHNPELTRERFVEHPAVPGERLYRTGDLARWLPDGNLEYLGREDQQVKIRGVRIELGEIENVLRQIPGVIDCVVTTKTYSESVILIIAYVVVKEKIDPAALKRELRRSLPEAMVPSHFQEIAAVPLTATGKADRRALPDPVLGPSSRPA